MPFDGKNFTETKPIVDPLLDALVKAREAYTPPDQYVQFVCTPDENGRRCAMGWIWHFAPSSSYATRFIQEVAASLYPGHGTLSTVNDQYGHDAALRVLDRAIALRRAEEARRG